MKHPISEGARLALATARQSLTSAKERLDAPEGKDQDALVAGVDRWREETFVTEEEA